MKSHNYFSIKNGEDITVTTNQVLGIGEAVKNNKAYAKYIAFGSGGGIDALGKIINIVKILPVTLTDINNNATKGMLHAEYSATFSAVDSGVVFSELSLCANADGSEAVNYATCKLITVDVFCEVSVTIFVDVDGPVKFCGGNNKLASFLLGESAMVGNFSIASGNCTYPNKPLNRDSDGILHIVPITPIFSKNGIIFRTSDLRSSVEILVLFNSSPVLRIMPEYSTKTVNASCKVNLTKNAGIIPNFAYEVSNVRLNNMGLSQYEVVNAISGITFVKDLLPFNIGRVGKFIMEENLLYIACVTATEVIVLRNDISKFSVVMRLPYNGESVDILSNGRISLWSDTLKIYSRSVRTTYVVSEIALACGEANAIVSDGNKLHAVRYFNGNIERYEILDEQIMKLSSVESGAGTKIFKDGAYLGYYGDNCPPCVCTITQTNVEAQRNIADMLNSYPGKTITINDGMACIHDGVKFSVVINLDSNATTTFMGNVNCVVGAEVYAAQDGANITVGYLDKWDGRLTDGLNIYNSQKIVGICKTKFAILILYESGMINGIYLNSSDIYLRSNDFKYNDTVSYIARVKNVPPENERGLTMIELTL